MGVIVARSRLRAEMQVRQSQSETNAQSAVLFTAYASRRRLLRPRVRSILKARDADAATCYALESWLMTWGASQEALRRSSA
jgi:predicted transcriptional regulator